MSAFDARAYVSDACFSDLHKDAYGFRPSGDQWAAWSTMSEAELLEEEQYMIRVMEREIDEENQRKADAAARFEAAVAATVAAGAGDRATAIRWMIDAEDCSEDVAHYGMEAFEWRMGIDFGYIAGAARPLWQEAA